MPSKAGSFKRVTNPDDGNQFVDLPIVDKLILRTGQGQTFVRRIIDFINHVRNDVRVVIEREVTHQALDVDGTPTGGIDDPSQRVVYELITDYTSKHGQGVEFFRHIIKLNQDPETNGRQTHHRRINGAGANAECFIDVERTDVMTLTTGQGQTFRREIIRIVWNDDSFDNTDRNTVPLIEGPNNGFDPPWRLDPLQNIVNVQWVRQDNAVVTGTFAALVYAIVEGGDPSFRGMFGQYEDSEEVNWGTINCATYNRSLGRFFMGLTSNDEGFFGAIAGPNIITSTDGVTWGYSISPPGLIAAGMISQLDSNGVSFGGGSPTWMGYERNEHATYCLIEGSQGYTEAGPTLFPTTWQQMFKTTNGTTWVLDSEQRAGAGVCRQPFQEYVSGTITDWLDDESTVSVRVRLQQPFWLGGTGVNESDTPALRHNSNVEISRDGGDTWAASDTGHTGTTNHGATQVAIGNGVICVAGSSGIMTASDGFDWSNTLAPESASVPIYSVAFASGQFVVVDNNDSGFGGSKIATSVDGYSWETELDDGDFRVGGSRATVSGRI